MMMQEAGVNATASSYPKALPGSGIAEKWGLDLSFLRKKGPWGYREAK